MVHPQNRPGPFTFTTKVFARASFIFALVAISALGMAVVSVSSHYAGPKASALQRSDDSRMNHRVSVKENRSTHANAAAPMALSMALATITVDRVDDVAAASACTAAASDCSLRGAVSYANSNPGTTISVPAGTYLLGIAGGFAEGFNGDNTVGDLDITANNTAINGASAATTIIRQTQPNDRVIEVNPFLDAAFAFSISNVTVTGGSETTAVGGGGMIAGSIDNVTTVTNCVFSANSATGAGTFGGGGMSVAGGSLTITGTTISGNSTSGSGGGLGYSAGDPLARTPSTGILSITGSTFSSNSAGSGAGGGGAADLFDYNGSASVYNISGTSFQSNSATSASGGAIIVESGGPLTITTSSFASNTAAITGGAISSGGTGTSVTFSRFFNNSVPTPANGLAIYRSSGTLSANDNWWGVNSGPGANAVITPTVPLITWLQLEVSASPNSICSGATSTLTADIKKRNAGANLTVELNGLPAFPVPPSPTFGNAVLGTLSSVATQYVNGSATAVYTAGGVSGTGSADAFADNESETVSITIASNATSDPANVTVCQGATANFSTTASGPGPYHYAWTVDGSAFDGDNPSISVPTGSLSPGGHTVTVTTTGACGSATQSATLTVNEATTTSDPADATVCQGASAGFSTTAAGSGPFSYAWTVDGSPFGGNTSSISVPTGALSVGPHTVAVTTTGACGSASQSATLTVQASTATTDPADATVCQGATAGFSTTASGTGPFSYAWTVDGSAFGGNTSSISVPTGSLSVGSHTVAVTTSGTCGGASQSATLTVQETTSTTDPADATVCQGATAGFSTTASGTGPFTYAWTVDGTAFGGNTSSISVPTGSLSVGTHTVAVTTSGTCGVASQSATLTVQANTTASDPSDRTVCQGAMAGFSTTASGTNVHYAWTLDGSPFNGDSSSINVDTGTISVGSHTVGLTVTGACGTVAQSANLTVNANTVASDPADQTVCQGATASFSTTASGSNVHYTWTLDGSPFNGDSPNINVPTGSLSVGSHAIGLAVTGDCGTVTQSATLTVQANTSTTDPADATVCQGATAGFSTTASGTGPFTYAWTVDGSPFGGNTSSISVPTGSLPVGSHTVAVTTSGTCGVASQSATLTVQENTSATTPPSQTVCQGTPATFSTTASGAGPFTYQWKLDGSNISGATGSSVTINTSSLSAGSHSVDVVVNGTCGSVIRSTTLTVNTAPVVTLNPVSQTASSGTVTFTAAASGSPTPTVQWQVSTNGGASFSDIPGATSTSLTVVVSPAVNGNQYRAVFTNSCGTATTTAATLTTCNPPVITLSQSTISMWPPNHDYHSFNVTDFVASAISNCYGDITSSVVITSVHSDESENGNGDGNTLNDILIGADCKTVQLRSERDGSGNGRVYTINFKVTDAAGNTTTATATVSVPISQLGSPAVNGPGPGYTVTSTCP